MCAAACIWRAEGSLRESVLSFHRVIHRVELRLWDWCQGPLRLELPPWPLIILLHSLALKCDEVKFYKNVVPGFCSKRAKIWMQRQSATTPGVLPMSFVSIPIKDQFAPNVVLECAMCHTSHLACLYTEGEKAQRHCSPPWAPHSLQGPKQCSNESLIHGWRYEDAPLMRSFGDFQTAQ